MFNTKEDSRVAERILSSAACAATGSVKCNLAFLQRTCDFENFDFFERLTALSGCTLIILHSKKYSLYLVETKLYCIAISKVCAMQYRSWDLRNDVNISLNDNKCIKLMKTRGGTT